MNSIQSVQNVTPYVSLRVLTSQACHECGLVKQKLRAVAVSGDEDLL